jgi:hypothetical protein
MNSYRRAKTIIWHCESLVEICIHRGVKRGDPLVTFHIQRRYGTSSGATRSLQGYKINNNYHISSLAFADDLILLANDEQKAQQQLHHTELYLKT